MFPGAQLLSLAERIEGLHNFRRVKLSSIRQSIKLQKESGSVSPSWVFSKARGDQSSCVIGVGMPSKEGIRRLLTELNAGPTGTRTLFWTSLREEPVIFVKGRPHVLRLYQNPLRVSLHKLESGDHRDCQGEGRSDGSSDEGRDYRRFEIT